MRTIGANFREIYSLTVKKPWRCYQHLGASSFKQQTFIPYFRFYSQFAPCLWQWGTKGRKAKPSKLAGCKPANRLKNIQEYVVKQRLKMDAEVGTEPASTALQAA
ncbi:MAG: hypothetical protein ABFS22_03155 [Pseudomonadota bacterium]